MGIRKLRAWLLIIYCSSSPDQFLHGCYLLQAGSTSSGQQKKKYCTYCYYTQVRFTIATDSVMKLLFPVGLILIPMVEIKRTPHVQTVQVQVIGFSGVKLENRTSLLLLGKVSLIMCCGYRLQAEAFTIGRSLPASNFSIWVLEYRGSVILFVISYAY